ARRVQRKLDWLTNTQLKVTISEGDHLPLCDTCRQQAHRSVPRSFCRILFDANIVRTCQASDYTRAMTTPYHTVIRCALRYCQVQAIVAQDEWLPRVTGIGRTIQ